MILTTEDGVDLDVQVDGPDQPVATVVLAHGYQLEQGFWDSQGRALRAAHPLVRVVTYDHRGHGRSGATQRETATLSRLAHDLHAVVAATATGPLVLVGHSMGGMTVMALLEEHPEVLEQLAGVGFVATSAGGLKSVDHGLPGPLAALSRVVVPRFNALAARREAAGRRQPPKPGMRWLLFGAEPDPQHVRQAVRALAACPAATAEAFYWALQDHERAHVLAPLRHLPVLIACGDRDRLTPLEHTRRLAEELPQAELVVYPGAGHMLMLERAADLDRRLVALVATALRPAAQRAG